MEKEKNRDEELRIFQFIGKAQRTKNRNLEEILIYIPLATFIIFVVTDGIFSLTSALIFVISTIGPLINWKREKTEMKN